MHKFLDKVSIRCDYSSDQLDNKVRDSGLAAIWCAAGGYWGLHEIYLNRPLFYLVRNGVLAAVFVISDFCNSNIPIAAYIALVAIESIGLSRGALVFNSRQTISLSRPSRTMRAIAHALAILALLGSLCVVFVPA